MPNVIVINKIHSYLVTEFEMDFDYSRWIISKFFTNTLNKKTPLKLDFKGVFKVKRSP